MENTRVFNPKVFPLVSISEYYFISSFIIASSTLRASLFLMFLFISQSNILAFIFVIIVSIKRATRGFMRLTASLLPFVSMIHGVVNITSIYPMSDLFNVSLNAHVYFMSMMSQSFLGVSKFTGLGVLCGFQHWRE